MLQRLTFVTTCLLFVPGSVTYGQEVEAINHLLKVSCEGAKASNRGLPYVVAVTITNHAPPASYPDDWMKYSKEERLEITQRVRIANFRVARFDFMMTHDPPFSVEIRRLDNQEVVVPPVVPGLLAFYRHEWRDLNVEGPFNPNRFRRDRVLVKAGASYTFVADLEPWLSGLPLDTDYEVRVRIYKMQSGGYSSKDLGGWWSDPITIHLKQLDDVSRALLDSTVPRFGVPVHDDQDRVVKWLDPGIERDLLHATLPHDVWQAISPYCVVVEVVEQRRAGGDRNVFLESLPDHLNPLAAMLRFERIRTAGDDAAVEKFGKQIAEEYPGLKPYIEQASGEKRILDLAEQHMEEAWSKTPDADGTVSPDENDRVDSGGRDEQ